MSSCCEPPEPPEPPEQADHCGGASAKKSRPDALLWSTLILVAIGYGLDLFAADSIQHWLSLAGLAEAIRSLMDSMWIGLALGMFFVGVLGRVPREFVTSLLGKRDSFLGIVRATFAGVLLDLQSRYLIGGDALISTWCKLGTSHGLSNCKSVELIIIDRDFDCFDWLAMDITL